METVDPGVEARRYAPPGGETFEAVRARVEDALTSLRKSGAGNVLIVTHAGPLHAALDVLFGEVAVRFEPASITRVRLREDDAELLSLGITVRQYAEFKQGDGPR